MPQRLWPGPPVTCCGDYWYWDNLQGRGQWREGVLGVGKVAVEAPSNTLFPVSFYPALIQVPLIQRGLPCLTLLLLWPCFGPTALSSYVHICAYLRTFLMLSSDYCQSVGVISSGNLYILQENIHRATCRQQYKWSIRSSQLKREAGLFLAARTLRVCILIY